jgi:hypothetical protein
MANKFKKIKIMKKVSIIALMVITIVSSVFAGDNNALNFKGADAFKKLYPHATKVVYEVKKDYTQVHFTWNNIDLQAFFDRQGELIGTSRNIAVSDLPLSYVRNINNAYEGYTITEAIEFDHAQNGMSYYVSVINGERAYVLNVATDGTISVFKKMKN